MQTLDLGFQADTIPSLYGALRVPSCLQANIFEALYNSSLRSVSRRIRILEFAAKCISGFKTHCLLLIFAIYYIIFLLHQWIMGRKRASPLTSKPFLVNCLSFGQVWVKELEECWQGWPDAQLLLRSRSRGSSWQIEGGSFQSRCHVAHCELWLLLSLHPKPQTIENWWVSGQ